MLLLDLIKAPIPPSPPVELEEGAPLLLQLVPLEARHARVMAVPVVVAPAGLRVLITWNARMAFCSAK